MHTYLITYGAESEHATFDADSPAHAVEQFAAWAPVSPEHDDNVDAITGVMLCLPVKPTEDGTGYAHCSDGSYFGLDNLAVTFVPDSALDPDDDHAIERHLFS